MASYTEWSGVGRYATTPNRTNWYHTDMIILVGGEKGGTGKSTIEVPTFHQTRRPEDHTAV